MRSKKKSGLGNKVLGLMLDKTQRKREVLQNTAVYSFGMAAIFAVPAFFALLQGRISFNDVLLLFFVVNGVSFTTIYLLLDRSKKLAKQQIKLKKVNR